MTVTADAPSSTGTGTAAHKVALSFEDGVTRFIECREDQSVADASYRARINIPVDCSDGACGTCKAFCESGSYDGGSYLEDALTDDEAEQGYLLACQATPRSDMVVQIATTSAVAKTSATTHRGTVTAVNRLSDTTVDLRIEIEQRDKLAFLPGQYVNIAVPGTEVTRSYSFSNGPDETELSFLVKITPGGTMSEYLDQRAAAGDEIELTGPHGSFFLRESEAPLLLLAGGTGLAPILSILRTLAATGSERPVHLFYGATTDDDVVELDTLRGLAEKTGLTWDYCVADKQTAAPNQGYVTALIEAEHLHHGDAAVYLCGPRRWWRRCGRSSPTRGTSRPDSTSRSSRWPPRRTRRRGRRPPPSPRPRHPTPTVRRPRPTNRPSPRPPWPRRPMWMGTSRPSVAGRAVASTGRPSRCSATPSPCSAGAGRSRSGPPTRCGASPVSRSALRSAPVGTSPTSTTTPT
nr:benzoate 1,2-dioxygenase electron transfer component BenC [Pseudonocardia sp. AL041005-10]